MAKMMFVKKKKNPTRLSIKVAVIFTLIVLALLFLFDSEGLKTWAEQLKDQNTRAIFLPPLQGWYGAMDTIGFTGVRRLVREGLFEPVRGARFPDPEPETMAVDLPGDALQEDTDGSVVFSPANPMDILVMGDSMAGMGIPPMFYQAIAGNQAFRPTYEAHVSSSITTPIYYDWPKNIRLIIQQQLQKYKAPFDVIVVIIGSNDMQAIKINGRMVSYNSPEWEPQFRIQAREMMDILAENSRMVYWVGVPPMRLEGYKDRMVRLNGIYADLCDGYPSITFVPLKYLIGDENGLYTPVKIVDNTQQSLRTSDGIHFDYPGAKLVVEEVMRRIRVDFKFAKPE